MDCYFLQTADIDLSGKTWEPIGYSGQVGCYFAGNYDGGNHIISNAVSQGKQDARGFSTAGIFGWLAYGSISNLHVRNADFTAASKGNYSYAGGVCAVSLLATVTKCSVMDSRIESKRDGNNNCAGGVVGYVAHSTLSDCASERNTVQSTSHAGGFVGELDNDNGGSNKSSFTNCYVAEAAVSAPVYKSFDTSHAGGFVGHINAYELYLTNCYVFDTTYVCDPNGHPHDQGVMYGDFYSGDDIVDVNCYYGDTTDDNHIGSAVKQTAAQFADGTVLNKLGVPYIAGKDYPILASRPADYTAVNEAIDQANALNPSDYSNFNVVEDAVAAVIPGKTIVEQAAVDAMAQAILDAISALKPNVAPVPPATGDAADIALWIAALFLTSALMMFMRKRRA